MDARYCLLALISDNRVLPPLCRRIGQIHIIVIAFSSKTGQ